MPTSRREEQKPPRIRLRFGVRDAELEYLSESADYTILIELDGVLFLGLHIPNGSSLCSTFAIKSGILIVVSHLRSARQSMCA
jgi:hypothetical protein